MSLPLQFEPPDPSEAAYRAAIDAFLALPPQDRAEAYERTLFPHAAARAWGLRGDVPPAALLVVPVGTQPYSPLLAILATPAPHVALLVTEEQSGANGIRSPGSRPTAARVEAALERGLPGGAPTPQVSVFSIGQGTDGRAVVEALGAALFAAGDPWPLGVAVDVSGGRKSTTSALGGIAAVHGHRLSYIEGRHLVGPYFVDEERHALADVAALCHADERSAASALLEAGAFRAAAGAFARVADGLLAGPVVLWLAELASVLAYPGSGLPEVELASLAGRLPECSARAALRAGHATRVELGRAFLAALREEGAWR